MGLDQRCPSDDSDANRTTSELSIISGRFIPGSYIILLHIYRAVFYPPPIMGPPSSHYILYMLQLQVSLSHNRAIQTASPQIALEEANLPKSYRITLSLLRIFCNSLHSYRKSIGLVPSPLYPSCDLMLHTTVHVFFCSSRSTPLT